jgi:hypothetical protein
VRGRIAAVGVVGDGLVDLVPGTCCTPEQYWFWLLDQHGITRMPHRVHPDYCLDGDDCGCLMLRNEGRCPYNVEQYQRIVLARREQAARQTTAIARRRR